MAGGYALWNIGILRGNLTLLATVSYFAPVLSSAFASVWLGDVLNKQFWQGGRCWLQQDRLSVGKLLDSEVIQYERWVLGASYDVRFRTNVSV
ncbi:hypothetical protein [Pseudomonas sp. Pseusp16]|uniref:hypothetical protein n=1 Tax=Pseudomonas sp. Pseusp16 TaxID=3243021 RepID=UPI0039B56C8E